MVRWAGSPLTQAQAHVVVQHWDDILQHLAPPTVAWEWSESGLAPKTKHRLKKESLIEQTSSGSWRATERLWLDVIDRAGDDEDIGRGSEGQELLVDPVREERESRVLTLPDPAPTQGELEQQTLLGDVTDLDNADEEDRIETNLSKSENDPEDESKVAVGQLRLNVFAVGQTTIGEWVAALGARDRGAA